MEYPKAGLKYLEHFTSGLSFIYGIRRLIFAGHTQFQQVEIVDTDLFGRVLFLDGKIQSAEVDEYIFHESLVHPAMLTHGTPRSVLVIGGGEGATLREVLRYQTVQRAVMVDIDGELVDLCKKHLETWHQGAFDDPRSELVIEDARKYIFEGTERFDVIVSDLTEPVEGGPSTLLFTQEFYEKVRDRLDPEKGVLVVQSGTSAPVYSEFLASIVKTLKQVFRTVRPYWSYVFSFQMPWAYVIASNHLDPLEVPVDELESRMKAQALGPMRYYNPRLHHAMFVLPNYLLEHLETKGRVLTDENPFTWEA